MADTYEEALNQVRSEEPSTPAPDPTPAGNEVSQPTTPAQPTEPDYPQGVRDYLTQNPDHAPVAEQLNKQFQAAFTPRLQEAAELRKRYEGVDDNVVAAVRHLQQLIATDPRNAAEYLRQQAVLLEGTQNPQAQPDPTNTDPYSQYEPATDVEALLLKEVQALRQWQTEQTTQFQQVQTQQKAVGVRQEFNKLQQELGIEVPIEDQAKAWELSEATQGRLSVTDAYIAINRSDLLPKIAQRARDEASGIVQQKQGMSVPGGLNTRGGPAPTTGPGDFDSIFRELYGRDLA